MDNGSESSPFKYYTVFSLFVSFMILIWSWFRKIDVSLFIFAYCVITTVCIMGSLYIAIPHLDYYIKYHDLDSKQVIMYDLLIHVFPLIMAILLFKYNLKNVDRTTGSGSGSGSEGNILKKCIFLTFFTSFIYLLINKFNNVYVNYDLVVLMILNYSVFISSFKIYYNLMKQG
jgi:hypothetical protein